MLRESELYDTEVGRVWFNKGKRKSEREINKILCRSKTAIYNVLNKKELHLKHK